MFGLGNVLVGFSALFQVGNTGPWWLLWMLLIIGLLSLVVTWLSQMFGSQAVATNGAEVAASAQHVPAEAVQGVGTTPSIDDLTRIEGIGPKISSLLQNAGITTFSQLAATETSRLEEILQEAKLSLANPDTWPEQAKLAAAGEWDTLETLQDELKGGRRVD